jgi:hypothetical protein
MATTPTLRTRMNTEAQANNAVSGWSQTETAVEILHEDIQALEVPTPPTGTDATQVQGTAADNAVTVGKPVQVGGVAQTAASYSPVYTNGDQAVIAVDKDSGGVLCHTRKLTTTDDALVATPVASSLANSTAYAASLVVKGSAGRLFCVNGYNSKATAQFIQVLNSATLPADTAVPVAIITVPGVSNFSVDFGPLGIPLSTGIVLSNSSTGPTKTIGSADVYFTASYV